MHSIKRGKTRRVTINVSHADYAQLHKVARARGFTDSKMGAVAIGMFVSVEKKNLRGKQQRYSF